VQIDLSVLGHAVRITTRDETVGRAIDSFWEPAKTEAGGGLDAKRRRLDYVFEAGRLYFRGEIVARADTEVELLGAFERHLLDTLVAAGRDTCMLHAGAASLNGDLFILVGPSGAGKSTFTRLLVQAGARYLSDDLLSLRGDVLDGAARSIQFDALTDDDVPSYYASCTLVDYPSPGVPPGGLRVPLYRAGYRGAGPLRLLDQRVVLLRLERGPAPLLVTLPALERLACLHAATLVGGQTYAGGLDHGLAFGVVWSDPEQALESVLGSLAH